MKGWQLAMQNTAVAYPSCLEKTMHAEKQKPPAFAHDLQFIPCCHSVLARSNHVASMHKRVVRVGRQLPAERPPARSGSKFVARTSYS